MSSPMSKDFMTYKRHHHALVTPWPAQGHINPSIHLAIKLASNGFTVTFANTEVYHNKTIDDILNKAEKSGLNIHYITVSDGLPIDFDRSLNQIEYFTSLSYNFPREVESLIQKSVSSDSPITCLVMDINLPWFADLGKKFQLPYVSYWTNSARFLSIRYNTYGHMDSGEPRDAFTSYLQAIMRKVRYADYILCNTAEELELETIQSQQLEKHVHCIGPLMPEGFTKSKVQTESDCSDHQWLNSKPAGSVLYISFGTYAQISKKELEEIAYGVMQSGTNFIWALRPDIIGLNDPNPLPDGFLEATEGRGIVVTWCSQTEVLNHESVGGFLTHCGWNSVMESIRSEVPMLCYPLALDQFTNRNFVVQDWSVGIDLGGRDTNVYRGDVAEKITRLMSADGGRSIRMQVKEISKRLNTAICPYGSSTKNLNKFIELLVNHH